MSRWSCPEIARELAARCQVNVSASSVRRWLSADALKPWQHRSWISIRDPHFETKAARVLDLYAGRWKGRRLGPNDFVICADEKTSIQARCRCHPTLPPGRARAMRVEHDYDRQGALAYLAAWDVHRGQVIGRCEDTTGIDPFARLVEQVMTTEPYASANRVFWIVDNGSSHRGQASIDRMNTAWPTAHLIHTPVHASWLNQCEITSPSSNEKSCPRTTSPTPTRSATGSPRSRPLQPDRHALRLEVHPPRPAPTHRPARPPPRRSPTGGVVTPEGLTGATTWSRP